MESVRQILGAKGTTVHTVSPTATVLSALKQMAEKNIGALVVLEDGEVVGIVSERDYARKVILRGKASSDTPISEIMETNPVSVNSTQVVGECMTLMSDHRVRHLPVIENGQLVGLVSIGDIVKAIIDGQQSTIDDLQRYITGRP